MKISVTKLIAVMLLCALVVSLCGCAVLEMFFGSDTEPPSLDESAYSMLKYPDMNAYVQAKLGTDCVQVMPAQEVASEGRCEYRYHYRCGLLGDPSFSLLLNADYSGCAAFDKELERLNAMEPKRGQTADGVYYLYFSDVALAAQRYFDEEIYDGCVNRFDFARIDEADQSIDYCIAHIQDNNAADDWLLPFIEEIRADLAQ